MSGPESRPEGMRLDKWLWAARFFKTRQLAVDAVNGGHVHLDGRRTKPGREIQAGSRLQIGKDGLEWDIEVLVLPRQRRPAAEAAHFYRESEGSRERRHRLLAERQTQGAAIALRTGGRPNKRERRLIHRFKQSRQG
jgi:ribosome-associated heat shock protein Hsp15